MSFQGLWSNYVRGKGIVFPELARLPVYSLLEYIRTYRCMQVSCELCFCNPSRNRTALSSLLVTKEAKCDLGRRRELHHGDYIVVPDQQRRRPLGWPMEFYRLTKHMSCSWEVIRIEFHSRGKLLFEASSIYPTNNRTDKRYVKVLSATDSVGNHMNYLF